MLVFDFDLDFLCLVLVSPLPFALLFFFSMFCFCVVPVLACLLLLRLLLFWCVVSLSGVPFHDWSHSYVCLFSFLLEDSPVSQLPYYTNSYLCNLFCCYWLVSAELDAETETDLLDVGWRG